MLEPFNLPFVQEGLIEILLLSIPAGLIGSWIVLRGLAFHSHAIGTATFPGLVLADGIGFSAALGAFGAAGVFTVLSATLARSRRTATDSVTALALVACLAAGVILASDVFRSGTNVDTLLFGSLLAIDPGDIRLAAAAATLAVIATLLLGHHWLAKGFDEESAAGLRSGSVLFDTVLLAVVAITVIASVNAVGALLVSALMVVPAATVRLFARRVLTLQIATILLVVLEGTFGLWLSVETNAPPGATIAVVSGVAFVASFGARAIGRRAGGRSAAALAAAMALVGLVAGCSDPNSGGDGPKAVATTTQVHDIVGEVGGDRVNLTGILQPNTDPHEYEPRPSDVAAVADAEVIFRSGGHLDQWTEDLIKDSGSDAAIVDLSRNLPVKLHSDEHSEEHGSNEGDLDPHWWQDPVNVRAAASKIETALVEVAPDDSGYFRNRTRSFEEKIGKLTRRIRTCLKRIPAPDRKIVTDHDAFGYFTGRFGIETVGTVIPALTTEAQPSAGDLAELEETIRREGVKAIFPESSVSPALAEAVARDTAASTEYSLYGDTLGPSGSDGETWLGSIKANTDAMVRGMSGGRFGCFGVLGG